MNPSTLFSLMPAISRSLGRLPLLEESEGGSANGAFPGRETFFVFAYSLHFLHLSPLPRRALSLSPLRPSLLPLPRKFTHPSLPSRRRV